MTRPLLALAVLAVLCFAAPASAATTFTVTKTADTNDGSCTPANCSLRDAVTAANAAAGADTITVPSGHFTLTNPGGDLQITQDVTINGAGSAATVVDGNLAGRIFDIVGGTTKVSLDGLTLTRGKQTAGSAIQTVGAELALNDVSLTDNLASGGGNGFGPIFGNSAGNTSVTITNSSFTGNVAGGGGFIGYGLVALSTGGNLTLNVANTRLAGNRLGGDGITGSNAEALFRLSASAGSGTVTFSNTVFTGNKSGGAGNAGGGFVVFDSAPPSSLTIQNSTFSGNSSGGGGGSGIGGIYYSTPDAATLTVTGSTFNDNSSGGGGAGGSGLGGALYFTPFGGNSTVNISDSTFSGNSAGGGGGMGSGGAIYLNPVGAATATANFNNVTIVGNSAGGGGGAGLGGGYFLNSSVTSKVVNSIITDNVSGGGPANCSMGVTSLGHNIENAATCAFTGPGDQITEPLLGPLGDYGGPTQTRPPLPGSPAIDHGAGCAATDQRGLARPFGAACDVGAYEYAPPVPTTGAASSLTTTSAVIAGQVSPNLRPATSQFDYGPTSSYGSKTATQTGGGLGSLPVSATLTGLTPGTTYHYRLVATGDNTSLGADRTFTTRLPSLSRLKLSPTKFPAAPAGTSITKKRKTGTTVTYTATDASITTFRVLKPAAGRRQGKSCRKPSARNRRGRKCTRYIALRGSFSHKDKAGRNRLHFTGRLRRHKLKPGKYRLSATPKAGGKNGRTRNVAFRIIP